jgi:hypothetical protein
VYTDDVEWHDPRPAELRRRRVLLGVVVALVIVCAVGLVVGNAQLHSSRGVAALHQSDYVRAQAELSASKLVLLPYRDSALLAEYAGDGVRLEAAKAFTSNARADAVTSALERAAAALEDRDAARFTDALVSVSDADLQKVLRGDSAAQAAEQTLAEGLTTIARNALRAQKWEKAETWASALLALRPASPEAADVSLKAEKGRELSARLADAGDAARRGEWRKALRLALGVAAVRKGFPGASTLIAEARRALARQRARAAAAASAAAQPAATGGTTSSGASSSSSSSSGSSSGSSSQPPPP